MSACWVTTTSNLVYHNHDYTYFNAFINEDGSVGEVAYEEGPNIFLIHGWILWAAWGIFALV